MLTIMKNLQTIFLLTVYCSHLIACNLLNSTPTSNETSTTEMNQENKPVEKTLYSSSPIIESNPIQITKTHSEIELIWKVPEKRVNKYLLNYGYSADNLEFRKEVELENLEQFDDGTNGQVYRYVIKNVAADKSVYITITAIDKETSSKPSEVTTVLPN
jgi:hypothetical protein